MKTFEFSTATKIVFGRGEARRLAEHVAASGRRVLLVTGSEPRRHGDVVAALEMALDVVATLPVAGEPSIELAQRGVAVARENEADVVVGLGGGSAIDAGKAIAALANHPGEPLDYLEVIGRGLRLDRPSLPYFAVPTTSGTGAEVTKNAVLAAEEQAVKVSLRSPLMLPRLALIDPELTVTAPARVTAQTGLDALTQVIEPYLSCKANPLTDPLCIAAMGHARAGLRRAVEQGADVDARERMSLVSLFGGLALANAKLGAVHGIAGPFGGMFPAAHGAICARLLPTVMQANLDALRERAPTHPALGRFADVAAALLGRATATPEEGIEWLQALVSDVSIPRLGAYGYTAQHADALVEKSLRASSMKGNPIPLNHDELHRVLDACL